jgi:hypothetical protein
LQDDDIRDNTRFVDPEMMISSETLVKALEKALKHLKVEKASSQNIMNKMEQTSKERSGWRGTNSAKLEEDKLQVYDELGDKR